jgi:CheY-like chemotaxis protein
MLQATRYDIVLLDINMPVMNGFELCETLRRMPQYKEAPIIFITGNGDFQNRAQGILSGGNDLITKPTSPLELVLKTTMHLLQPQGRRPETMAGATAQRQDVPPVVPQSAMAVQGAPPQDVAPKPEPPKILAPAEGFSNTQPSPAVAARLSLPEERIELPKPDDRGELVRPEINNAPAPPASAPPVSAPPEVNRKLAWPEPLAKPAAAPHLSPPSDENLHLNMQTKPKSAFDEIAQGVARIIFGDDNLTEMNVRLTRIALEHNKIPEMQTFDEMAQNVARVIFGDENLTEMNVRLTRIALERYNVPEMFNRFAGVNNAPVGVSRLSTVAR